MRTEKRTTHNSIKSDSQTTNSLKILLTYLHRRVNNVNLNPAITFNPASMKKQHRKSLFNYLSDQFIGRLTGFVIGIWASQLVHHFFTTRNIHNLWGLTAKKTVVSKQTFGNLEWIASVLIGYLVFEIVLRIMKNKVDPWLSTLRFRLLRRMAEGGWKIKRLRMR